MCMGVTVQACPNVVLKDTHNVHGDDSRACLNLVVKDTRNVHGDDSTESKCGSERHS